MIIRSRAPLRISFGGGGTDVPPYCNEYGGVTLNSTINMYTFTTWELSNTKLHLDSADLKLKKNIENIGSYSGDYDLIEATLKLAGIDEKHHTGKISMHGDAPIGTGLGTSSSAVVSLLGAIWDLTDLSKSEPLNLPSTKYKLAELACKIEREELKIPGGYQDQYASTFGGFNWTEFKKDGTVELVPLSIPKSTLNEFKSRLLLVFTGSTRLGGNIIKKQQESFQKGQNLEYLNRIKELAFEMRNELGKGNITEFGRLLHESWMQKRQVAEGTSTDELDKIYSIARGAGAIGGKISGAGGGGVMFFIVNEPIQKQRLLRTLNSAKPELYELPFSFETTGIYTWRGS